MICSAWAGVVDLPAARPDLTDPEWERLLLVASEILWALTGRQWSGGGCTATAEWSPNPDGTGCWRTLADPLLWPVSVVPQRTVLHHRLQLPHDEVTAVDSVTINGEAFTGWRREGAWLIRTDGLDFSACGGYPVVVAYQWGFVPPAGGVDAAVTFAVELAKAKAGDGSCRLPKRVTSVTRQGVTVAFLDPQNYLREGRTGLTDVDQWIVSVNPRGRAERGSVWSPDMPQSRLV